MKESNVARYLQRRIKASNGLIYKIVFEGQAHCPDYIIFMKGRTVLVETKAPRQTPRPSQIYLFSLIAAHASRVEVVCDYNEVDELVDRLTKEE